MKKVIQRMQQPTPRFFRYIRNVGLMLTAVGTTTLSIGVALPQLVIDIASYAVVAGAIATAVSQTAVYRDDY